MSKKQYRVRIREKIGSYKWVLKSRFYNVNSPREAAQKYTGNGEIIRVEKVPRGFGSFFTLGDKLMAEFAEEDRREKEVKQPINLEPAPLVPSKAKRYYERQKRGVY